MKKAEARAKGQREINLPKLEYRTGAWVLERWVGECDEPSTLKESHRKKLYALQGAILSALPEGKKPDVPHDLIIHEHEVAELPARLAHRRVKDASSAEEQRAILRDAVIEYRSGASALTRPLLLQRTESDLERMRSRIAASNVKPSDFVFEVVGQLFSVRAGAVEDALAHKSRFSANKAQVFLTAQFLIAARAKASKQLQDNLLSILSALKVSNYDERALYHLAKHASRGGLSPIGYQVKWDIVRSVIAGLRLKRT